MIVRYRCVDSIIVDQCDEDGFSTGDVMFINEGDVYELDTDNAYRIAGGEIHLDLVDSARHDADVNGAWIEISQKDLDEYFERGDN